MNKYTTRQSKKSLGIQNLKGVTVNNRATGNGFVVTFRAEAIKGEDRYYGSYQHDAITAAADANNIFKAIYGNKRAAKKANRWNEIN